MMDLRMWQADFQKQANQLIPRKRQTLSATPPPRYGPMQKVIKWCNIPNDKQEHVLEWKRLRDILFEGAIELGFAQVCEAGFGGDQYQITLGSEHLQPNQEGEAAYLKHFESLRNRLSGIGKQVKTPDPILVFEVTLPNRDESALTLKPQLAKRESDERKLTPMPNADLQPRMFQANNGQTEREGWARGKRLWQYGRGSVRKGSQGYYAEVLDMVDGDVQAREEFGTLAEAQDWVERKVHSRASLSQTFLDTILHTALGTATSIGVAKALSASVVPGGVQTDPPQAPIKEETEEEKRKRESRTAVFSPSYVEGDQAQVELGTLLQEIDAILKKPDDMGIVDGDSLRILRG